MIVNEISQNTYINIPYSNCPYRVYLAKNSSKNQGDTFEKQKAPYSVENSADNFASDLFELMNSGKFNKDNVRQLARQYVPRTKVEDNWEKLFASGCAAQFVYNSHISNNNKKHYPRKKIIVNMNVIESKPSDLFNSIVHEMVHNLQLNKEKKVFNTIYSDYFEDSLNLHKACSNLFDKGMAHGSKMIGENFNNTFGVFKFSERENYKAVKNKNVDKFVNNPEKRSDLIQIYDLAVLNLLSQEEEAYTMADIFEYKYFNTQNKRAKKNERLFRDLKEIVEDDLKKSGMSEKKIKEYKDLIGW
ncbi:hypothetical protein IJI31_07040 [bacterium]|nr:hypothetical protein [bacterium]